MRQLLVRFIMVWFGLWTLASCGGGETEQHTSMNPNSKDPLGMYLFNKALNHYFPGTPVHQLKSNFNFTEYDYVQSSNELMILIGETIFFSEEETAALLNYVYNGNHLILSAGAFDTTLQQNLFFSPTDKSQRGDGELKIVNNDTITKYQALSISTEGIQPDESYDAGVKGFYNNYPNLVLYRWGSGTLMLHSNPHEFTNLSMLGDNKKYVEALLGFRNDRQYSKIIFSSFLHHDSRITDLDLLLQYPSFRWAFYIALALLGAFVLFEFKRRQKIVPEIAINNNNTKAFIETIGHLYFNKGNLNNLAEKKILYFLEHVRSRYYLDTRHIDNVFADKLHIKSQVPLERINILVSLIRKVYDKIPLDNEDIFTLDSIIKLFNHGHHK